MPYWNSHKPTFNRNFTAHKVNKITKIVLTYSQCPFCEIFVQKLFFMSKTVDKSKFIIKIISSTHKTSFNIFWRFHKNLLILPSKSKISRTFLALHFEGTRVHSIFYNWHVGWTQFIHTKLNFGAQMCPSEIFDLFSNLGQ